MGGARNKKNVKPILIISFIALLPVFNNGAIGRRIINNARLTTTSFQPSSFELPVGAVSSPFKYLDHNDTCIPQPNLPLSRGHFVISNIDYAHLTGITAESSEAICMLTRSVLELFQSQMSLEIVNNKWLERRNATEKPYVVRNNAFDVKHYQDLHQYSAAHFQLKDISSDTCTNEKPRIGILNRANYSWRSILNAEEVALSAAKTLSRDDFIQVGYFENQNLSDQVAFFRSVDILIAPHGAHLTGLAFIDAPCSHLLELFPKRYSIPYYYGSLAMSNGKKYSYLYMSEQFFVLPLQRLSDI
ncbi:unnamed protein product [Cylindrotheca closterium]|uniref:Glycosyltransferase 61 catalytic domain-containing protein n=1 Tax=Cylindrotheca closterium TaxID=2856 RepID=A0AAD2JH47_9STRA|nr:unnamed protein product [Cylindrotheca closterium]